MQAVDDDIETIHLYVVKEEEKKPSIFLHLLAAFLCLATIIGVTIYSALNPIYVYETLTIPAQFLPLQTFSTTKAIIPTGIKAYPATTAHGELTIYNGSIITQIIPAGFTVISKGGLQFATDTAVTVPAGNPPNYGRATVPAYAKIQGKYGNIQANTINQVFGSSLYIRNTHPFRGGQDAYSVKIITPQDRQTALGAARVSLTAQVARKQAILAEPCIERYSQIPSTLEASWACQFVSYPNLPGMKVTRVAIRGKNLIVDIVFIVRPKPMQGSKR